MEEQQFKVTYRNKAREVRVDNNTNKLEHVQDGEFEIDKTALTREIQHFANTSVSNENLEPRISGENTTINVPERIGDRCPRTP